MHNESEWTGQCSETGRHTNMTGQDWGEQLHDPLLQQAKKSCQRASKKGHKIPLLTNVTIYTPDSGSLSLDTSDIKFVPKITSLYILATWGCRLRCLVATHKSDLLWDLLASPVPCSCLWEALYFLPPKSMGGLKKVLLKYAKQFFTFRRKALISARKNRGSKEYWKKNEGKRGMYVSTSLHLCWFHQPRSQQFYTVEGHPSMLINTCGVSHGW